MEIFLGDILEAAPARRNRKKNRRDSGRLRSRRPGDVQEDDIIYTAAQNKIRKELRKRNTTSGREAQGAIGRYITPWPNGRIFYSFSSGFTSSERSIIINAMNTISYKTGYCIRFYYSASATNRIRFEARNTGCWSYLGMTGGVQPINLETSAGCVHHGTIMHVLLHALGLIHENNRPDRDNYITIHWENIIPGAEGAFERQDVQIGTVYDYTSIMHFNSMALSANGAVTISPSDIIGQRSYLSALDVMTIKLFYCSP